MSDLRGLDGIEGELSTATGQRRVVLLSELAWALRFEDPERASRTATEVLARHASAEDESLRLAVGRARCALASVATTHGDLETCATLAQAVLDCPTARGDVTSLGAAATLLAGVHHVRGRQEVARKLLFETLGAISPEDRPGRLARIGLLNELGRASFALADWAAAHESFARALDLAHREGDRRLEGVLNVNLGNVLSELRESEGCLEHYREALAIHRSRSDAKGQALALHNLAVVHARTGEGPEAERCAREAMRLAESTGHRNHAQTGLLLADELLKRSEFEPARSLARTELERARESDSAPAMAMALCTLAKIERVGGRTTEAAALLAEGLALLEDVDDASPSLRLRIELARTHEAAGRTEEARAMADEAARTARASTTPSSLIDALKILERCHEAGGDAVGALSALRERSAAEIEELRRAADGRSEVLRTRHELDRALQRERALENQQAALEQEIAARTEALREANEELQAALREKRRSDGEREELADQLRRAQKMEAVGRLAGGIAHDFNNLLTVFRGHAELLLADLAEGTDQHASARHLVDACDRAARMTSQLLAFSRNRPREAQVLDINSLIEDLRELVQRLIGENVLLELDLTRDPACCEMDPGCLEQVLFNLAVNARDAMPEGGRLTVSTHRRSFDSPLQARTDHVVISVSDTGTGINPEAIELIFEPFFTTKPVGEGTGLGLATSYGLVRQVGGTILVTSTPGIGSTFEVLLPAIDRKAPSERSPTPITETRSVLPHRVLLVEDEASVRKLLQSGLESFGHDVTCAGDGLEALERIDSAESPFDVVVSDVVMPRMGGTELLGRLLTRETRPPMVLTSGWPDRADAPPGQAGRDYTFLEKPFRLASLAEAIESLLS